MKLKKVMSKKSGQVGFRARYTDPLTGRRMKKAFWFAERHDAEDAARKLISSRSRRVYNLSDNSGWTVTYDDLVKRFLKECVVSRETRRERHLKRNLLNIAVCGEFSARGALTAKCKVLAANRGEVFVIKCVQQPLKQLAAWAAEMQIIPFDPLRDWKKLSRKTPLRRKHAFTADELQAILRASDELDALNGCRYAQSVVFKTLLLTGNRPGALSNATVGDFDGRRIHLPPGNGKKRNGEATIPSGFVSELQRFLMMRGRPEPKERLLVSGEGKPLDDRNLRDGFKRAATYAFVQMLWPAQDHRTDFATPLEVTQSIYKGSPVGLSGPKPTDGEKKALRAKRRASIDTLTEMLKPQVEKLLADRPVYALRHTHVTWARRFADYDAVRLQVGHAGQNIQEQHYNDGEFVDAGLASEAVWHVLTGAKVIQKRETAQAVLPVAVGQVAPVLAPVEKNTQIGVKEPAQSSLQVKEGKGEGRNASWRTRTSDPVIKSHLLYQLS